MSLDHRFSAVAGCLPCRGGCRACFSAWRKRRAHRSRPQHGHHSAARFGPPARADTYFIDPDLVVVGAGRSAR